MSDRDVRKLAKIVADHSRQIKGLSGGPQAAHTSIESGSIDAYDSDGKMRLRIGAQDDGTHAIKYVQGPPPPRPTAPMVSVDGPVVRVRWDGELMGGHIPEDFARIDVHFALASDDIEDASAVRGNLATVAGNETVLAATQTGTYRVGLVAMSQSRARSEMSDTVEVDVTLVDLEGALDAVVENARGGSNYYTPTPPPGTGHTEDDLWFDTSEDEDGLTRYTPHRWDGQEWVSLGDERVQAIKDAQADFESDLNAVRDTADGKNRTFYQSTMPATPPARAGDLWFNTANGFRLHRNNGATFIEVADGRIADLQDDVENIDISGPLSEARTEWLADAAADAQQKAQNAAAAAEAAAKLYADQIAAGVEDVDLEGFKDYADNAAEQARQAAITAAIAEARVIANDARDEALAAALDADAVISQSVAQFESDLDLVRESADGKSKITWSPNAASGDGKAGDTWFRMSSNRIIGHWRHSGSTWVSMSLDATVIPNLDAGKITSGTIDAGRIGAKSITADKIAAGAVGATAIAAESIDASKIVAGSITADKLLIGGSQNLVTDPEFRSVGWGSSSTIIPGEGVNGANVLRIPPSSTTSGSYLGFSETLARFRFKANGGEKYRVSSFVTAPEDFVASRGRVYVRFYTLADKAAGSHTWGSPQSFGGPTGITPANEWVLVEGEVTAPPGAVEGAIGLYKDSNHTTSHLDHCAPVVRPMVGSTLIEDGAITTSKIEAGAITAQSGIIASLDAGVINSGTIDAARIQAGSLDGGVVLSEGSVGTTVIAGGAITTSKIASGAITAESGVIGSLDAGKITVGEMDGARIKAGSIGTEQLAFGAATGDILAVDALNFKTAVGLDIRGSSFRAGDAVEITEDFGIRQFGPDGALNVSLPSDGSEAQFRGDLSARSFTATGSAAFQGKAAVASGGVLELESGVVPPVSAPQPNPYVGRTAFPPLPQKERARGIAFADGHWWRFIDYESDWTRARIEKITPAGELVASFPFANKFWPWNGATAIGNELFVLGTKVGPGWSTRFVQVYSTTGAFLREWEYPNYGTGGYQPGIGTDGTNILIGQVWATTGRADTLTWRTFNRTTGALLSETHTSYKIASDVIAVDVLEADFGAQRAVVTTGRQTGAVEVYTPSGTHVSYGGWHAGDGQTVRGTVWQGGRFHHMTAGGDLVTMGSVAYPTGSPAADDAEWWVAVTWFDGTHETTLGPSRQTTLPRRTDLRVTVGGAPADVGRARVYLARSSTPPAASQFRRVGETAVDAEQAIIVLPADWSTRPAPPVSNGFPDGTPGEIRSTIGQFHVDGTGAGRWGPLTFHADGTMTGIPKVAAGYALVTNQVAGETTSLVVTLPAGVFSSDPSVLVTPSTSVPYTTVRGVSAGDASPDSFTLYVNRSNTTNTGVAWVAIERTV